VLPVGEARIYVDHPIAMAPLLFQIMGHFQLVTGRSVSTLKGLRQYFMRQDEARWHHPIYA
jgi:hypothetical protein